MRRSKLTRIVYDCAMEAGYPMDVAGDLAEAVDNPAVKRVAHGTYGTDEGVSCPLALAGRPGSFEQQAAFWREFDSRMFSKATLPFNGVGRSEIKVTG